VWTHQPTPTKEEDQVKVARLVYGVVRMAGEMHSQKWEGSAFA